MELLGESHVTIRDDSFPYVIYIVVIVIAYLNYWDVSLESLCISLRNMR